MCFMSTVSLKWGHVSTSMLFDVMFFLLLRNSEHYITILQFNVFCIRANIFICSLSSGPFQLFYV